MNATAQRRILVVDDNPDTAGGLARLLALEGHDTQVVHDGLAALDAIRLFGPDLVLMDIGMPGLDGLDVARRVREDERGGGRRTRLVAMTGFGPVEHRHSTGAGFDDHLVKPIELDTLRAVVAESRGP